MAKGQSREEIKQSFLISEYSLRDAGPNSNRLRIIIL